MARRNILRRSTGISICCCDDKVEPINIEPNVDTTAQGQSICQYTCELGTANFYTHNDSGDNQSFSGDSQWLAIQCGGMWYGVNSSTGDCILLSDAAPAGNLRNTNTVWQAGNNANYYSFQGNELQLRTVGNVIPLATMTLPATLTGPDGSTLINPLYRLAAGSGSPTPIIIVEDITDSAVTGVIPFNPTTLALDPHWWVQNALQAGVTNGTALAVQGYLHNIEVRLGGVVGAIEPPGGSGDTHQHWVPLDGSDAVLIEPFDVGNPTNNPYSHQAYSGNYQITSEFGFLKISEFGSPPSLANETTVCNVPESELNATLPAGAGFTVYQHGHIIGECGVFSTLDSTNTSSRGLAVIDWSGGSCTVTPIYDNVQNTAGSFFGSARPTISPDKTQIAWHEEIAGQRVIRCANVTIPTCDCTTFTVDVPTAPNSPGVAPGAGPLAGSTDFNLYSVITQFNGTIGSGVTPGTTVISYTGNSNNGLGTACSGTVTLNNQNGDITYTNYLQGEECETCYLEFMFQDTVGGCPCTTTAYIPFHPEPSDGTTGCVGPIEVVECPPTGPGPTPCGNCVAGTDFDCILDPELALFYDGNSVNPDILEAIADAFSGVIPLEYTNQECRYFYGNDLPGGGSVSVLLSVLADKIIVEVKIRDSAGAVIAQLELGKLCAAVECDANHALTQQDFFTTDGSDFGTSTATFNPNSFINPTTC